MLASVAEQANLSLTWSETPEDTFSHDEAHLYEDDSEQDDTPKAYDTTNKDILRTKLKSYGINGKNVPGFKFNI